MDGCLQAVDLRVGSRPCCVCRRPRGILVKGGPEKEERCANKHADYQGSHQTHHKTRQMSSSRGYAHYGPGPGLAWLLDRHLFKARGKVISLPQAFSYPGNDLGLL